MKDFYVILICVVLYLLMPCLGLIFDGEGAFSAFLGFLFTGIGGVGAMGLCNQFATRKLLARAVLAVVQIAIAIVFIVCVGDFSFYLDYTCGMFYGIVLCGISCLVALFGIIIPDTIKKRS